MTSARRQRWIAYGATAVVAMVAAGPGAIDASGRKAQPSKPKPAPALALRGTSPSPEQPSVKPPASPPTSVAITPLPKPPAKTAADWTTVEIAAAKSECETLLKTLKLDYSYAPSVRHGSCGSAQPIEVRAFGVKPAIAVQPPATMNCRLAAKLATWLATDVQPLARAELHSDVVAVKNEAAYDCRNRYGDPNQKLSEHATANALDVGAFTLANGSVQSVAGAWGPVLRDLIKSARDAKAPKPANGFAAKVTRADGSNPSTATLPALTAELAAKKHLGSTAIRAAMHDEAVALGVAPPAPQSAGARFIHGVHASACRAFGTVLGPEANDAHREHFHLDLAPRPGSSYCE